MSEEYPRPEMTFKQKIENYWYHHKWITIVGAFFVAFLLIATVQLITNTEADISILYVGEKVLGENACDAISESAGKRIFDGNGDGEVFAEVRTIFLPSDLDLLSQGQKNEAMEQYRVYSDEMLGGDSQILILDEYFYTELAESGTLVNLYDVFLDQMPSSAFDFYGLRLGKTPLYQMEGFKELPADAVLCLKYTSVLSDEDESSRLEKDQLNREMFARLVNGDAS